MPEQTVTMRKVTLPKRIQQQYETFAKDSVLYTGKATINAINAGVKVKKLLQLCTGAVYKDDGTSEGIHTERYDLVMELVKQRKRINDEQKRLRRNIATLGEAKVNRALTKKFSTRLGKNEAAIAKINAQIVTLDETIHVKRQALTALVKSIKLGE